MHLSSIVNNAPHIVSDGGAGVAFLRRDGNQTLVSPILARDNDDGDTIIYSILIAAPGGSVSRPLPTSRTLRILVATINM